MAKKKGTEISIPTLRGTGHENKTFIELFAHYQDWRRDSDIRRTRVNGWNDVTDAYWGELPKDWPYDSRVIDPRIRTAIIDKDARLINSKLRGRLVPREGSDVLSARLNNALLDYQWDSANDGGSMEQKLLISSQDSRLYASKFAHVPWKKKVDEDGNIVFEGNEFEPLDIRDCGINPAADNIKNAKWFQWREWVYLEDLLDYNKTAKKGAKLQNLGKLKGVLTDNNVSTSSGGDKRSKRFTSRVKELKGLEDKLGMDVAFPIVEMVHEYRCDRVISFTPTHGLIHRDIPNPYDHKKIPIAQLKYYPLQDDPLGESEVEAVLPLWRAIQAVVCGFLDEMNIKMRPPIKIVEGQARIETIVYGPEAQWLVNNINAVEEMRSDSGAIIGYFRNTYSSLVSAFNVAMGELSQGISGVDPFNPEKTATEVKATTRQQNVRDQRNQMDLAQFIKDVMMMWLSNNRQFLFSNPEKKQFILRVVGNENFEYFKRSGLDEMEVPEESMNEISEIIQMQEGNVGDDDIMNMVESAKVPRFPVDADDGNIQPKMRMSDVEDSAELTITPEDLQGTFDYIPDVKSMATGADVELQEGRLRAVELLTGNQTLIQQLAAEGFRPKVKEIVSAVLEDQGLKDAQRFFESIQQGGPEEAIAQAGGVQQNLQVPGVPGAPTPGPQGGNIGQTLAQPGGQQVPGRLSQALQ